VYLQGTENLSVTITANSGGNYENVATTGTVAAVVTVAPISQVTLPPSTEPTTITPAPSVPPPVTNINSSTSPVTTVLSSLETGIVPSISAGTGGTDVALPGIASGLGLPPAPSAPVSAAPQQPAGIDQLNTLPATAAGPVVPAAAEVVTAGFPIARIPQFEIPVDVAGGATEQIRDERLFVYQGVQNSQSASPTAIELEIPREAFAHTNPSAVVRLEAVLADGTPLPPWLEFDQVAGTIRGIPPTPADAELDIKIVARDDAGRQAEVIFRPVLADPGTIAGAPGAGGQAGAFGAPAGATTALGGAAGAVTGPGFPVERVGGGVAVVGAGNNDLGVGEQRLFVYQGVREAVSESAERYVYQIPKDAFAHTDPGAVVRLQATLADGSPLPAWLIFDPVNGTLSGMPPDGIPIEIEVKITARDDAGREANVIFAPTISGAPGTAGRAPGEQAATDAKLIGQPGSGADGQGLKLGGDTGLLSEIASMNSGLAGLAGAFAEGGGFQLTRVDADSMAASGLLNVGGEGHRLFVYNGIPDINFLGNRSFTFTVPPDAFAHTDPGATVLLEARLSSGEALPSWLSFNPVTGLFSGTVPPSGRGVLELEIIARDEEGRIARSQFRIDLDAINAPAEQPVEAAEVAVAEPAPLIYDKDAVEIDAEGKEVLADADEAKKAKAEAEKIKRGAVSFSEQAQIARAARDPILARILATQASGAGKPVNPT